jgi:hypothetical protein
MARGEPTITIEGATVTYEGPISDENIEQFLNAVKGKQLTTLVISSGGGEINAGMKMGSWVYDNGIDVVVEKMCMSSCANYVFPAGRSKIINKGAIVAWHGSILQESVMSDEDVRKSAKEAYDTLPESMKQTRSLDEWTRSAIEQTRAYKAASTTNQSAFFKKIGVDEFICRVGSEKYGVKDFYILSVEDMKRFGVTNVHAPEDYEKTDLTPFLKKGKPIEFIKLSD